MASTNQPDDAYDSAQSDGPSFFSMENLKVIQVPFVGGTLNGFSIGFVGVYAQMYLISTDCSMYKAPDSCKHMPNDDCVWNASTPTDQFCGWKDITCGRAYTEEDPCIADTRCKWIKDDDDPDESKCENPSGYDATESGIFAGAMILGAMVGSIFAGQFVSRFGHKIAFWVIGVVGVVSSVLYHVAAGVDQFWVLCTGRVMIGVVLGLTCVACPMYVDQNAPRKFLKVDGVFYQLSTTFGIMIAATMGLALGQSIDYKKNVHIIGRMEGFCGFSTLLSFLMIALAIVQGESKVKFGGGGGDDDADGEEKEGAAALDPNEYSYMQMIGPLSMGVVTAGTLQMTGINAVMNYAPTIMSTLGMEPLVGNFVVMMWNFVTTIVAIPLARILTMRQLFLSASLVAACACLFLCGIPVYPGVASSKDVKNGVAIFGIAVYIAGFAIGVGPCFFVLAQDLFPRSFRPKGASFTIMAQFVFNLIINVCYPIVTEAVSGDDSADKGQAVAFIFFGCVGLVCFVLQLLFLFPWEEADTAGAQRDDDHSLDANHPPVEIATPAGNQQVA